MNKIKFILRCLTDFFHDIREFSPGVALGRLRKELPIGNWKKRREYYENCILKYLYNRYSNIFILDSNDSNFFRDKNNPSEYVWVMWWQGQDSMPGIVRSCYNSVCKEFNNKRIVLITEDNYKEYINLPAYIIDKFKKGMISITHLSDIIRVMLLNQYGGLWIDSTVLVHNLPISFFERKFFSLHNPGMFPEFIFKGEWSTFLLYFKYPNSLFTSILEEFYLVYWKQHNSAIDYLVFDYAIRIMYNNINFIKASIDSLPINNSFYLLNMKLLDNYNANDFKNILDASPFHKLTYKKEKNSESGESTYLDYILKKGLE